MFGHDKIEILHLPTPLEHLKNISEDTGVNFYIKRDDLTNLATGGNKLRKLEYFLKDALDKGASMLITEGGAQTNHGRLTAAVAAKYGLKAAIVTADKYPGMISANLLLDGMLGCPVYFVNDVEKDIPGIIARYEEQGERVYRIPMGGSNEMGILGYAECGVEVDKQAKDLGIGDAYVVSTIGSMGTYMGILAGLKSIKSDLKLLGISIFPYPEGLKNSLAEYGLKIKKFFGLDFNFEDDDFFVRTEYDFGDYNNPVKEVREAVYYMARKEAIILDPCYTGKTFAGLLDIIRKGDIPQGSNVIFMHTGGLPGIYTEHHRVEFEKELMPFMHIENE